MGMDELAVCKMVKYGIKLLPESMRGIKNLFHKGAELLPVF